MRIIFDSSKVRCLIDTGACGSLIRRDAIGLASKFIDKNEQPTKLVAWNDSVNTITESVYLNVKIGPKRFSAKFLVVPEKVMGSQRCILGKQVLIKLGLWTVIEEFLHERLNL